MRACRHCGWSLDAGDLLCPNCANTVGKVRPASRECPCGVGRLGRARTGGVEAYACRDCGGIWFGWGALSRLLKREADRPPGPRPKRRRRRKRFARVPCVRCRRPMQKNIFARTSGVMVDFCRGHGVWLDPGELTLLRAFARSSKGRRVLLDTALEARLH